MYVKTISTGYTRTFNLKNGNSITLETSLSAVILPEEDEEACIAILQDKCRESVREEYFKCINKSDAVATFTINSPGNYGENEKEETIET
ncbi:MAG: hypothetical protein ACKPBH_20200 [Dolichospermum sp.]